MRIAILTILLLTTPAMAEPDFTGRWADNEAACLGQPDVPPVEITASTYKGYEQSCVFERVDATFVKGSFEPVWWTARMRCKGEGTVETTTSEFLLNRDGNSLFETPIHNGVRGDTIARNRCPWD